MQGCALALVAPCGSSCRPPRAAPYPSERSFSLLRPAAARSVVTMASSIGSLPAAAAVSAAAATELPEAPSSSSPVIVPSQGGSSTSGNGSSDASASSSSFNGDNLSTVSVALELQELEQLGKAEAEVEQLRTELGELRSLLIAQARLVQNQQQHIQQIETAVGHAMVEKAPATSSVASAAMAALQTASTEASMLVLPGDADFVAGSSGRETSSDSGGRSVLLEGVMAEEERANRMLQAAELQDRRLTGLFDARYHSTSWGATPRDMRVLPKRIFLVRHAESEGNVDNIAYTYLPDPRVPLTARGWQQAMQAGDRLRVHMEAAADGKPYKLFFYTSPYLRSRQTYEGLAQAFRPEQVKGVQEEVQLREQDFGNFQASCQPPPVPLFEALLAMWDLLQDAEGKKQEKAERLRFGRFFYRFPNGESGADVYDRMTIFEDHLVRDINAGRFADSSSLVLVTHGLALRIFLMRWFHWTVDQFMSVFNPPNAEPLVLERVPSDVEARQGGPAAWIHTKALYRLSNSSREVIKGCTEEMCQTSWAPRQINPLELGDSMLLP